VLKNQVESTVSADSPEFRPAKRKRRTKQQPAYLQQEEVERFFRVIDSPRDRAIFRLMYHAGLRASEVGILQLRDYNQRTERIYIHRLKGSNSGEHHLVREESRVLHAWLKVRGSLPGPMFPSNRRTGIKRSMIDVLVKHYGEIAGIPEKFRHAHIFKHTCATHLFDRGFGIEQVQDWLGHVNVQSTAVYAHITNERRAQMANELRESWR
jgi:type 1 fimbriae regulatory protein FimB